MKIFSRLSSALILSIALYGCGGGGNGGGNGGDSYLGDNDLLPAGKATLTFSAASAAPLAAPISGIDFTLTLPPGISVATASNLPGKILDSSLTTGSAPELKTTNLAFGSYSASTNKVHLTMATTSDTFRSGEFLRLACTVAANTNITLGGLKAGAPVTVIKASGIDPATTSTVVLTNSLNVTLGALR